ncbi:MAG: response regulator transcription factor [Anaerolineae bacterium]|nr:response regulator transcription factor [Anaerolineae bacterium]
MGDKTIQILVVDDHQMVRIGLMTVIKSFDNMQVSGEASNGQEAILVCQKTQPDVVLMDIKMPMLDGIEATKRILTEYPHIRVIGLTSFNQDDLIKDMLLAGASGCLLKDASREEIQEAIINAVTGKVIMSHHTMHRLLHHTDPTNPLSDRENDVLKLMIQGMTNQEIADNLFVSQSTIKFHVSNILVKLGVNTRTEAVSYALKNHFFDKI